jgi:hypothetical protein
LFGFLFVPLKVEQHHNPGGVSAYDEYPTVKAPPSVHTRVEVEIPVTPSSEEHNWEPTHSLEFSVFIKSNAVHP